MKQRACGLPHRIFSRIALTHKRTINVNVLFPFSVASSTASPLAAAPHLSSTGEGSQWMLEKWRAIPWSIWGGTTFRQGMKVGKEEREEMGREGEKEWRRPGMFDERMRQGAEVSIPCKTEGFVFRSTLHWNAICFDLLLSTEHSKTNNSHRKESLWESPQHAQHGDTAYTADGGEWSVDLNDAGRHAGYNLVLM